MKYLTLIFVLLFSISVFGQNKPVLTNQSVIDLVKAGISDVIIITKIKSSNVNFDTSTDALINLKNNNVSNNIQTAMFERAAEMQTQAAQKDTGEITLEAPENGNLSELAGKSKVYFYTDDTEARNIMAKELEKYSGLQSVATPDESDFTLIYAIVDTIYNGDFVGKVGEFYAITRGATRDAQGRTRVRIHYSVRIAQETIFDLNPAKSTMRRFIKEIKNVRK